MHGFIPLVRLIYRRFNTSWIFYRSTIALKDGATLCYTGTNSLNLGLVYSIRHLPFHAFRWCFRWVFAIGFSFWESSLWITGSFSRSLFPSPQVQISSSSIRLWACIDQLTTGAVPQTTCHWSAGDQRSWQVDGRIKFCDCMLIYVVFACLSNLICYLHAPNFNSLSFRARLYFACVMDIRCNFYVEKLLL